MLLRFVKGFVKRPQNISVFVSRFLVEQAVPIVPDFLFKWGSFVDVNLHCGFFVIRAGFSDLFADFWHNLDLLLWPVSCFCHGFSICDFS